MLTSFRRPTHDDLCRRILKTRHTQLAASVALHADASDLNLVKLKDASDTFKNQREALLKRFYPGATECRALGNEVLIRTADGTLICVYTEPEN